MICFEMTEEETIQSKKWFFERTGFPSVIGVIDGTHMNIIIRPTENEHLFFNRKDNHSLNAMVVIIFIIFFYGS